MQPTRQIVCGNLPPRNLSRFFERLLELFAEFFLLGLNAVRLFLLLPFFIFPSNPRGRLCGTLCGVFNVDVVNNLEEQCFTLLAVV